MLFSIVVNADIEIEHHVGTGYNVGFCGVLSDFEC